MSRVAASALVLVAVAFVVILGAGTILSGAQSYNRTLLTPEANDTMNQVEAYSVTVFGGFNWGIIVLVGVFFVALIAFMAGVLRR